MNAPSLRPTTAAFLNRILKLENQQTSWGLIKIWSLIFCMGGATLFLLIKSHESQGSMGNTLLFFIFPVILSSTLFLLEVSKFEGFYQSEKTFKLSINSISEWLLIALAILFLCRSRPPHSLNPNWKDFAIMVIDLGAVGMTLIALFKMFSMARSLQTQLAFAVTGFVQLSGQGILFMLQIVCTLLSVWTFELFLGEWTLWGHTIGSLQHRVFATLFLFIVFKLIERVRWIPLLSGNIKIPRRQIWILILYCLYNVILRL